MSLWEVLVPAQAHYCPFFWAKVASIAGGYTVLPDVDGGWHTPVGLARGPSIPVRVACPREDVERVADEAAVAFGQHAVMFWKVSDEAVIKSYGGGTP